MPKNTSIFSPSWLGDIICPSLISLIVIAEVKILILIINLAVILYVIVRFIQISTTLKTLGEVTHVQILLSLTPVEFS